MDKSNLGHVSHSGIAWKFIWQLRNCGDLCVYTLDSAASIKGLFDARISDRGLAGMTAAAPLEHEKFVNTRTEASQYLIYVLNVAKPCLVLPSPKFHPRIRGSVILRQMRDQTKLRMQCVIANKDR